MKRLVILGVAILTVILLAPVSCGETSTSPPETEPPTSEQPPASEPPETSSPAAQDLSAQIAGIDITETTALTSLFRISEELDQTHSDGSLSEEEEAELRTDLMARFTAWVNTREDLLGLNSLSPPPIQGQITWSEQDKVLLEGADERIEQYRKGDATVSVVDATGTPVADAVVRMDMLKHDFLFGGFSCLLVPSLTQSQAYRESFARLFNYATMTFFWEYYEPLPGHDNEGESKNIAIWLTDHGITVKGHPLIFPTFPVPYWAKYLSPEQLDEALHERVTRIVGNFRGLIDYWDVLNEPTTIDIYQEPLRSWMLAHTPVGAVVRSLEWARAANPEANLLVNDWRNDDQYHAILEDIIASGVRFDAIGLQSYMHTGRWTLERVWNTCERFEDFNLPLHFTEIAVLSGDLTTVDDWPSYHAGWDTKPEDEAIQGEYVPALYTVLFSHPSMQATTWGNLSDLEAWLGAPAGLIRKDMSPKPAYEQLMRLIHQEWWTNTETTTDGQGEAIMRGFYGQYLLTVTSGTQSVQVLIHLEAGQDNIFEVQIP